MIWFALQVVSNSILRWQEARGTQEIDLVYSLALLIFGLIWPGSHQAREWRTLASLFFTSLASFTALMLLIHGPMGSLAIFWPALMSRLEPNRQAQRITLILLQWSLVACCYDNPLLFSLNVGVLVASLLQATGARPMRWFALGALALTAGPLAIAFCMSEPPEPVIKSILLIALPQLGLLVLTNKRPGPQVSAA